MAKSGLSGVDLINPYAPAMIFWNATRLICRKTKGGIEERKNSQMFGVFWRRKIGINFISWNRHKLTKF